MGATANFDRHDCRTPYSYSFSLLVRSVSCSLTPPVPHGRMAGARLPDGRDWRDWR